MKIRNGFVSNSSSSSFVVSFPRKPESVDDVFDMLFGTEDPVAQVNEYEYSIPSINIAQRVWDDVQVQLHRLPLSRPQIAEQLNKAAEQSFWQDIDRLTRLGELPEPWPHKETIDEEERVRREAVVDAYVAKRAAPMVAAILDALLTPESFTCAFEYSDDEGPIEIVMEHGNIFNHLPHQYISHH